MRTTARSGLNSGDFRQNRMACTSCDRKSFKAARLISSGIPLIDENAAELSAQLDRARLQGWLVTATITSLICLSLFGIVPRGNRTIAEQRQISRGLVLPELSDLDLAEVIEGAVVAHGRRPHRSRPLAERNALRRFLLPLKLHAAIESRHHRFAYPAETNALLDQT